MSSCRTRAVAAARSRREDPGGQADRVRVTPSHPDCENANLASSAPVGLTALKWGQGDLVSPTAYAVVLTAVTHASSQPDQRQGDGARLRQADSCATCQGDEAVNLTATPAVHLTVVTSVSAVTLTSLRPDAPPWRQHDRFRSQANVLSA